MPAPEPEPASPSSQGTGWAKVRAAAIVLGGVGFQLQMPGLVVEMSDMAAIVVFWLGIPITAIGLYKWAQARNISRWLAVAAILPIIGPVLGLLVSPPQIVPKEQALQEPKLPLRAHFGVFFAVVGVVVSLMPPLVELGLAAAVFGVSLCLSCINEEPERRRLQSAIILLGLLAAGGLLCLMLLNPFKGFPS